MTAVDAGGPTCGRTARRAVDSRTVVHRPSSARRRPCGSLWTAAGTPQPAADLRRTARRPQSTAPITTIKLSYDTQTRRKRADVKFRCERDVLVEALAHRRPGGRPSRGSAPGAVRRAPRAAGRPARAHRHRPRAHDPGRGRGRRRATTACGGARPGSPPTSCGRSSPARSTSRPTATRPTSPSGRSQFTVRPLSRRRVPAAAPSRPPTRCTLPASSFGEALRQVVARGQHRRGPADPHRRAAGRRGGRACAWWPPTPTGWPCATCPARACSREGQKVLVPSRALRELERVAAGAERGHAAPRRARRDLRGRRRCGSPPG